MNASGKKKKNVAKSAKGKQTMAASGGQPRVSRAARRRIRNAEKKRIEFKLGELNTPFGSLENISFKSGRGNGTVGLAEYAKNIQTQMPVMVGRSGANEIWRGTEYLQQVSSGVTDPQTGDILARVLINPSVFDETRIQQLAGLYQRYKFRRARIYYQADANATQSGSIIGFMDYDVDNLITANNPLNVKVAAAHFAQQPSKIWQSRAFDLGQVDAFTSLFIDTKGGTEDRLVYQGVFYLFAATSLPSLSALGTLYLEYEVEFSIPALENANLFSVPFLGLTGAGDGTTSAPFGTSVTPSLTGGYPANSMDYTYTGTGSSVFSLLSPEPGYYQIWSNQLYSCSSTNATGVTMSVTWSILAGDAVFVGGASSQSQTNMNVSAATAYTLSTVRSNFSGVIEISSFDTVQIQVSYPALPSNWSLNGTSQVRFMRLMPLEGVGMTTRQSRRDLGRRATFVLNEKELKTIKSRDNHSLASQRPLTDDGMGKLESPCSVACSCCKQEHR